MFGLSIPVALFVAADLAFVCWVSLFVLAPSQIFTRTVDLDGVPEGYQAIDEREVVKVMVKPDELGLVASLSVDGSQDRS